jgi:hypothetical protein
MRASPKVTALVGMALFPKEKAAQRRRKVESLLVRGTVAG